MNASFGYRALATIGAIAAASSVVLAVLLARAGISAGFPSDLIAAVLCYFVGTFAFWKRPQLLAARRLLLLGTIYLGDMAAERLLSFAAIRDGAVPWFWAGNAADQALQLAVLCALLALFAVFPDGAYQRPYERLLAHLPWVVVPLLPLILLVARSTLFVNPYVILAGPNQLSASPLHLPALAISEPLAQALWWAPFPLLTLLAVAVLALRYRRFGHEQRVQIMWPLFAALGLAVALASTLLSLYGLVPELLPIILFQATIMLLPLTLAVGLLRHRLFDIELVLRKSLVYGSLWLAISMAYLAITAALGIAAGRELPIGLVVLVTISLTLLLQPARRRLERLADRWVFGERLSGYELLTRFGATLESAFDLNQLIPRVAAAVQQGLGVEWVRVSLRRGEGDRAPAMVWAEGIDAGAPAPPVATASLAHGGEQFGRIECGPKFDSPFQPADYELLATLGRQTALVVRNVRLAAELSERLDQIEVQARELAASRTRIVQAGEEERRRLERDLHDGAQQSLIALLAKTRLARNQLARDASVAERTLSELQEDTRQVIEELRELARGIHPPLLSDRGLVAAIEARAARLPFEIAVDADGLEQATRYAPEIEGAAYFFVCEGLTNVFKHAAARHTAVCLSSENGDLNIAIVDDGRGFDACATRSSGLQGLRDRIEALGGSVDIVSRPAAGTTLSARLPAREYYHDGSVADRDRRG